MIRLINKFETQQIIEELSISVVTGNSGWFYRNWIFHIVLESTFSSALYKDYAMLHALPVLRSPAGRDEGWMLYPLGAMLQGRANFFMDDTKAFMIMSTK